MFLYSIKLTFVSLSTIPLFMLLTFFLYRRLSADSSGPKRSATLKLNRFLVEALSGIQTVKAQNMELKKHAGSGKKNTLVTSVMDLRPY